MSERWLPIPGYPGYEASDQGRVRSLDRVTIRRNGHRYTCTGRVLTGYVSYDGRKGYRVVAIKRSCKRAPKVAVLVLTAFRGPRPFPKAEARHLNDISTDDRLVNLDWGTRAQQGEDMRRNGSKAGEKNRALLTESSVLEIRLALIIGAAPRELAKWYGVHFATISDIARRKTWRHI